MYKKVNYTQSSSAHNKRFTVQSTADFSDSNLNINPYTLFFKDRNLEKSFKGMISKGRKIYFKVAYYVLILVFAGYTLGDLLIEKPSETNDDDDSILAFIRFGFIICFLAVSIVLFTQRMQTRYQMIIGGVSLCCDMLITNKINS